MKGASKTVKTGKIIAFEGIDGAGKTTQARRAQKWLISRHYQVTFLKEPTDSISGRKIQQTAKNGRLSVEAELELFLADRRWNVKTNINPALRSGNVVILDRYYYSTIAYQGARGLDPGEIRRQNEDFAPKPDLVLLFDLDPETALDRIRKLRGETPNLFEKLDYLQKVREVFLTLDDPVVVRIDAAKSISAVWAQVEQCLLTAFPAEILP